MFEPTDRPRLFALPPGADFPAELVRGLIERSHDKAPEAMARVTLYLNTGRMLRAVRAAFDRHGTRFLPRFRLVTDLALDPAPGLALPVPPLQRRLELMRFVTALANGDAGFASPAAAIDLADSLARLLDEMQGEGVRSEIFEVADFADDHAIHWEQSLKFIRIVTRYLGSDDRPDPEGRRRKIVERLVGRWQNAAPPDPVIVAGSTGSRGTTLAFMRAVATLPQGAVLLPGFDFDMPISGWNSLVSGHIPIEDHPQYRFLALLRSLEADPSEVQEWRSGSAPDALRNRAFSLALRPAPVTDRWLSEGPSLGDLSLATRSVTVIEATTPREEAGAIALILRKAVEDGRRAALVTPDRVLSRRVAAALDRWGIVPDDSAGRPLIQSAPGRFLRQVSILGQPPIGADVLFALLKHPLTATGTDDRGPHLRYTRELELLVRRKGIAFPDRMFISNWATNSKDDAQIGWAAWVSDIVELATPSGSRPLSRWIDAHLASAEYIAHGPQGFGTESELWREAAGEVARRTMRNLASMADAAPEFGAADYASLIVSVLSAESVRETQAAHPLVAIRGTLEARVQGADLMILAGLNEGTWPGTPDPDPWLSRQMRRKAGLLSPERQIGLSAHDFQQAAGADEVVLSRAKRDDEADTVPSRWMSRIISLLSGLPEQGGPTALAGMRARGEVWLRRARSADAPRRDHFAPPAVRPAPRPPVDVRPKELPVTDISKLIRDPYAIYASRILRLRRLDPLLPRPDARLLGTVLHSIMEIFIRDRPEDETIEAARSRLRAVAEQVVDDRVPWPGTRRIYLAKLDRVAGGFVADEARRMTEGRALLIEESGSVQLGSVDFRLTARPDRIDLLKDGGLHIYDYKSGKPPSVKQQDHFDKQLRLEAAMAERGGFASLGARRVAEAYHIGLGTDAGEHPAKLTPEILVETWAGLEALIATYARRETGYSSRRAVFQIRTAGDYDHLARAGEWEMSDLPTPEDVG
jgi:ATP-dependent helicase/nuclease subunit B